MKTKIFYIEDEPFLGRIVKESLESRSFEVVMLPDGKTAVNAFSLSNPDICVLDIMLPSRDGYSIAKEIRQINPDIPIIFVSAKTQTEDVLKGFDAGGNDYIRKPFSMEELIVRIHNLLGLKVQRGVTNLPEILSIGKYSYHPLTYELKFKDSTRKLSHREAILLTMLARNRNAITNRRDILLQLWGDDSFFNSRNLDVYITKLRDVLKEDPGVQIITIKGVGYHFACG
jgi:DNA-binding response OmpR family regulator